MRRLHDTGRSGWWFLIGFVPLVGQIVLLVFMVLDSDADENQYGPNPKNSPPTPTPQWIRKLVRIIVRAIRKLGIIVNWKRGIIVAVVLFFTGGIFGIGLMTYKIRELNTKLGWVSRQVSSIKREVSSIESEVESIERRLSSIEGEVSSIKYQLRFR